MRPKQKFSSDKSASEAFKQFLGKLSVRAILDNIVTANHPKRAPFQEMYAVLVEVNLTNHHDLLQSLLNLKVVEEVRDVVLSTPKKSYVIGVDTEKLAIVEEAASILKFLRENDICKAPYTSVSGPGLFLPRENVYFHSANTEYDFVRAAIEYLSKGNSIRLIQNQHHEIAGRGARRALLSGDESERHGHLGISGKTPIEKGHEQLSNVISLGN